MYQQDHGKYLFLGPLNYSFPNSVGVTSNSVKQFPVGCAPPSLGLLHPPRVCSTHPSQDTRLYSGKNNLLEHTFPGTSWSSTPSSTITVTSITITMSTSSGDIIMKGSSGNDDDPLPTSYCKEDTLFIFDW